MGGLIIEDDYDAEFRYDRSPVGAVQGLDPAGINVPALSPLHLVPSYQRGLLLGFGRLPERSIHAAVDGLRAALKEVDAL